ncbi:MAG TPA: CAP domain-containing protein [Phycisphaerae bacterium]|nr:CAP domain-containing protein [Phycisphaerae bacterium]HRW55010.1 CAP domain-containing protein [Phycisphaerae bacterium]
MSGSPTRQPNHDCNPPGDAIDRRRRGSLPSFGTIVAICALFSGLTAAQCDPSLNDTVAPSTTPNVVDSGSGATGNEAPATPAIGSTPSPAATLLEQLTLERINRARLLPAAEAQRYNIALDEGIPGQLSPTPKQPVAMNATLRETAADHSADMLRRNYFAHDTPEGVTPFDRMKANGYLYISAGENLAWRGTTGSLDPVETVEMQHEDLFVDRDIERRGHRTTMLNPSLREVGVSIQRGSFTRQSDGLEFSDSIMNTQDYGTPPSSPVFVLGVVYDDANRNGQYDHGEGLANSSVTLGNVVKSTNQAGGYAFSVHTAGVYDLRFASGQRQSITIEDGDANMKIDLVNRSKIVVNLGLGKLN